MFSDCFRKSHRDRHYVGVPVIWQIGLPNDKATYKPSFRALGSSPPSLREGSLNMFVKICLEWS